MTIHKALHPSDDGDSLYMPRKEGGRGLTSIEDSVDASIQRLEDYIEKHEGLITAIRIDTDSTIDNRMTIISKCSDVNGTINHIISVCSKLAQIEFNTKHDWVGRMIHWELRKKLKFDHTYKRYVHNPKFVLENETHKLL